MRLSPTPLPALVLAIGLCLNAERARAQEGGPSLLTLGLSVSLGMQHDSRPCNLAGTAGVQPDTDPCILFAGGTDLSLLWRGRLGAALGLYSVSGQAVRTGQMPAVADRVSVPLLFEARPLAFLIAPDETGYRARLLFGVSLRLGPSVEVSRTSSDSAALVGLTGTLAGEIPLSSSFRHAVSLRLAVHLLLAPRFSLNDGQVHSSPFATCRPEEDAACAPPSEKYHGYGAVAQTYVGLIYYP